MQLAHILLLALFVSPVLAWDCSGHMLVASIAKHTIQNSTYTQAMKLINVLSEYYPRSADFITAACWADDLRGIGVEVYNSWHFINLPFVSGPVQFQLDAVPWEDNVVWGVENARDVLNNTDATVHDKAMFIRFLMHFVGDLHQPLHILTMYSDNFLPPGGDQGGNKFLIQGQNQSNLHAFYDAGGGPWDVYLNRPLQPSDQGWIDNWTELLMTKYPRSEFTTNLTDYLFDDWLHGVFKVSVNSIYDGVYDNSTLPPSYVATAQALCQMEVALAGYRLASVLDYVFSGISPTDDVFMSTPSVPSKAGLRGSVRTTHSTSGCATGNMRNCKRIDMV